MVAEALSCPICCTPLAQPQPRAASPQCPTCGVDLSLMQQLQHPAPAAATRDTPAQPRGAKPSRGFVQRFGRLTLYSAGILSLAFALLGLVLSMAFQADIGVGLFVGAQFGALLGTVFALTWTALDQYEPVLLWGPVISGVGAALVGLVNHAVITRTGLMPELTLFESVEVTAVAGTVTGLIAGAIKQRNA